MEFTQNARLMFNGLLIKYVKSAKVSIRTVEQLENRSV